MQRRVAPDLNQSVMEYLEKKRQWIIAFSCRNCKSIRYCTKNKYLKYEMNSLPSNNKGIIMDSSDKQWFECCFLFSLSSLSDSLLLFSQADVISQPFFISYYLVSSFPLHFIDFNLQRCHVVILFSFTNWLINDLSIGNMFLHPVTIEKCVEIVRSYQ